MLTSPRLVSFSAQILLQVRPKLGLKARSAPSHPPATLSLNPLNPQSLHGNAGEERRRGDATLHLADPPPARLCPGAGPLNFEPYGLGFVGVQGGTLNPKTKIDVPRLKEDTDPSPGLPQSKPLSSIPRKTFFPY